MQTRIFESPAKNSIQNHVILLHHIQLCDSLVELNSLGNLTQIPVHQDMLLPKLLTRNQP